MMWINDKDIIWGFLVPAVIVLTIGGWALIEFLIWICSNISISWGM